MDKQEILFWLERYGETETQSQKQSEEKLTKSFQDKGYANKAEIIELLNWKFKTKKGRLKRELNLIEKEPELCLIEKTKQAFQNSNDLEKIKTLRSIKGFGNAVCSVAMTFHNPKEYGVFDIHAWRELFWHESKSRDYGTPQGLLRFLEKLRELSKETGLTCREIEKAVFTKNLEKK